VNPFISVGRKFILLDACSILTVYRGVARVQELAMTAVIANPVTTALITASDIMFLFMVTTSFQVCLCFAEPLIRVSHTIYSLSYNLEANPGHV
jgi:hypothetical protein